MCLFSPVVATHRPKYKSEANPVRYDSHGSASNFQSGHDLCASAQAVDPLPEGDNPFEFIQIPSPFGDSFEIS